MNVQSQSPLSRRNLFGRMTDGLMGLALAHLWPEGLFADEPSAIPRAPDLRPRAPHYPARAKSVIQLFMNGGPSQMDLFDPKPLLGEYSGRPFPGDIDVQQSDQAGGILPSPFKFTRHGRSGIELSEVLPHLGPCVDDITFIRSMHTEHVNHEPALWAMHTGQIIPGRPCMPAWVLFGLGSANDNLPAFIVLDDESGLPIDGIRNWSSGWLSPLYQGTRFRAKDTPVWNLNPHRARSEDVVAGRRELLGSLDRIHFSQRPNESELEARLANYQMAARMQMEATDALELSEESEAMKRLYGIDAPVTDSYGRRCLMARRLVERGVRYVQIYINNQVWDNHSDLEKGLRDNCARTDKPVAALLQDLKSRGLLDSTLVIWGGEFGRLPLSQAGNGRDHNKDGFTIWMAGGGVKAGYVHGATDDFGYKAVEKPVSVHDFHATVLHLLGLDFERLKYNRNGLNERLTGVTKARVVSELLV
ncbi:MAG: DUF1501 domain-containing protein [Pirellulales bacterium]|nr:DUF1501 domain-containing protein [Pirellulales bacterium]